MKRLAILCILLLACTASAQEPVQMARMIPVIAGGGVPTAAVTPYCTGADTCTAITPGQCDTKCEDLEGATQCVAGESSTCRGSWTSVTETGGTVVFNASHSGTFACTDKGSYAIQVDKTGNNTVQARYTFSAAKDAVYAQFYFNIVAEGLSNGNYENAGHFVTSGGNSRMALRVYQTGDKLYQRFSYYNGTTDVNSVDTEISTGTWYRLRMAWVKSSGASDGIVLGYLNDTQILNIANNDGTDQIARLYLGGANSVGVATYTIQYDNISVDDDTGQGACN